MVNQHLNHRWIKEAVIATNFQYTVQGRVRAIHQRNNNKRSG
ncbi:hypothetical protein [Escherichia phage ZH4]|nr:hypothetical protein [Escherichia phage ZH4]